MPLPKALKVTRKTFFDPTSWIGYDELKTQNKTIFEIIFNLFVVPKAEKKETFEEAMQRFNISLSEVDNIASTYKNFALLFIVSGLVVLAFALYLLFFPVIITGFLLGIASSALLLVQAFKYDFWAFQIKHRKLGCTFAEWKSGKVDNKETRA